MEIIWKLRSKWSSFQLSTNLSLFYSLAWRVLQRFVCRGKKFSLKIILWIYQWPFRVLAQKYKYCKKLGTDSLTFSIIILTVILDLKHYNSTITRKIFTSKLAAILHKSYCTTCQKEKKIFPIEKTIYRVFLILRID